MSFSPLFARILLFFLCTLFASLGCKGKSDVPAAKYPSGQSESVPSGKFDANAPAPDFDFLDLNNQKRSLRDYRGKHVLLNFWATWCVPCVSEMGALERLYKTYKDKGFEIVAVNVDPVENLDAVKAFVRDNGITFTILRDSELSLPPIYGLEGFPESFFIAPNGKFLSFADPSGKSPVVRIVGDRAWDAPDFIQAVGALLPK